MPLHLYFASLFAFNLATALIVVACVVVVRRKQLSVTPIRGLLVFLIAWLGGSVFIFLIHLMFSMTGTLVGDRDIDGPLAMLVILPIVLMAHTRLSQATVKRLEHREA
jgi:hypothetical protein